MALDKITVIVNPTAGKGKCAKLWPEVEKFLNELGLSFETRFTERKGDATRLASEAINLGTQSILAVGGDGTINEVVNGVSDSPVNIGVIPTGSGNDFVRTLGLKPDDWRAACRIISKGHTESFDLGKVNGCHFINVAGVGFDAAVANCANVWAKQRFPGGIAYIAALLKVLVEYQPADITINLDDQTFSGRAWMVAVANAQYFGGGMWVAPKASTNDGFFDVCVLGDLSKVGFLRAFPSVFSGNHLNHPAIHFYRSRQVKVSASLPLLVQADGELIGQTPISFGILPHRIRVFAPTSEA